MFNSPQEAVECLSSHEFIPEPATSPVCTTPSYPVSSSGSSSEHTLSSGSSLPITDRTEGSLVEVTTLSVDVLRAGNTFAYTISTFSVITVQLQHVEIHIIEEMEYKKINAFMRDDPFITSTVPSTIDVLSYCTVDVLYILVIII